MYVGPDGLIKLQAWARLKNCLWPYFFTLNGMSKNLDKVCNRDKSDKARSSLKLISSFPFIVSMIITRNVFDFTIDETTLRDNHPADSVSDYYKKAVTIPLLDHLNAELKSRFDTHIICSYKGVSVVPAQMAGMISKNSTLYAWKENFKICAKFCIRSRELQLWEKYWMNYKGCRPN